MKIDEYRIKVLQQAVDALELIVDEYSFRWKWDDVADVTLKNMKMLKHEIAIIKQHNEE